MKVAFFQPYLAVWRIQFLSRFISSAEYEVLVYDGGFSPRRDSKSISNNKAEFPVHKFFSFSPVLSFRGQEYPIFFSPFLIFRLFWDRPDVVVTEGEINFLNNVQIYLYCRLMGRRYVWWSLGKVRTRRKNLINLMFDPIVDHLLYGASCVMARTSYAKKYYTEVKRVAERKVIVAPNSMDNHKALQELDSSVVCRLREINPGYRTVLYVGALTVPKRPMDLLEAFNLLPWKEHKLQLWFVGDGPERENLQRRALEMGMGKSVLFFGKIFDGVGNYFEASDLVVVPGLGGLVINHAMIFGRPVVSRLADGTELDLVEDGKT